jgi:hypothetical protein
MNCYVCDKQGKTTPAVAICILCGMALCGEHAVREELPVFHDVSAGMATVRQKLPAGLPRILCPECYRALHQSK